MKAVSDPSGRPSGDLAALREVGRILRRHRLTLALSLVLGVAAGLAFASRRAPTYEASALILVDEERAPSLSALGLLEGSADARKVGTEMELLRSRALAKAVVDSLGLQVQLVRPRSAGRAQLFSYVTASPDATAAAYRLVRQPDGRFAVVDDDTDRELGRFLPGEPIRLAHAVLVLAPGASGHEEIEVSVAPLGAAVDGLMGSLSVEQPGREVNLVRVGYRGSDPQLVRDVPNVLTARFMRLRESMQNEETRSTVSLLRDQLGQVGGQLAAAEAQLRSFREVEQVVDPKLEASTQLGHFAELQAQRAALEAERASLARVLADVQTRAAERSSGEASPFRQLMAFPTLLRSETGSELLRSLAEVENQRAQLASRRSADDPEMQILNARVLAMEQELKGMATTYLQGLNNQAAQMDATLSQYRSRLAETPEKEARYTQLSRRPQMLQEMYGLLQTRLKEAEIAQSVESPSVRLIEAADLPTKPTGPGSGLFAGVAGAFALLLGTGLVLAREYTDTRIRTRDDVRAAIGLPVLALIPGGARGSRLRWNPARLPGARLLLPSSTGNHRAGGTGPAAVAPRAERTPIVAAGDAPFGMTDGYSRLHANIMFARPEDEPKILLFTSPLPGDGKTTTAINFATTLAESGLKVLLIDADLRRGGVHQALGAPRGPGLANLLSESPDLEGVLRRLDVGQGQYLRYVSAGDAVSNPIQLLNSPAMKKLLDVVSQVYDRVIIDTPPLNLFPDAAILGSQASGVVVVARAGVTPFDALVDTAEQLRGAGGLALGAVLNGVDFERDASYDRAYRWYSLSKEYAS